MSFKEHDFVYDGMILHLVRKRQKARPITDVLFCKVAHTDNLNRHHSVLNQQIFRKFQKLMAQNLFKF